MNIHIINGPNLNLLGRREPDVYGNRTFEEFLEKLKKDFPEHNLSYYQSNVEGELINELHKATHYDVIIMNPGGYTHTSVAIADAIAAIEVPVIEVHISNIFAREEYRHVSITGKSCRGNISGFGLHSCKIAVEAAKNIDKTKNN
jgi:3-dehydroquinate dehydratase II